MGMLSHRATPTPLHLGCPRYPRRLTFWRAPANARCLKLSNYLLLTRARVAEHYELARPTCGATGA